MRILYARGPDPAADDTVQKLFAKAAPGSLLTLVDPPAVVGELSGVYTSYQALVVSPDIDAAASTDLIQRVRSGRLPVPVLSLQHRPTAQSFSAAVTAGADVVLAIDDRSPVQLSDALDRLRRSPYFHNLEEPQRLRLLYVGNDWLVWKLVEVGSTLVGERAECGPDGSCPIRADASAGGGLRCDAVLVDDRPGNASAGDVVRWLRRQAPDLPIVLLTRDKGDAGDADVSDSDVDEIIVKTGVYRPRLLTALRRVHRVHALSRANETLAARSVWLHEVVEDLAEGIIVLSRFGTMLVANQAALSALGATALADVLDKPLTEWVDEADHADLSAAIARARQGEAPTVRVTLDRRSGGPTAVTARVHTLRSGLQAGVLVRFSGPGDRAAEAETERLRQDLERTGEERAAWETERRAQAESRQEFERALATAERARRDAEQSLEAAATTRQDLEARLSSARAAAEAGLTEERQRFERERAALEERLARAETGRQSLETRMAELEVAAARAADLETAGQDLAGRLAAAEATLDDERLRFETERKQWDAERTSDHTTRHELERRRADAERAREAAEARLREVEAAAARAEELSKRSDDLARSLAASEAALDDERRRFENAENGWHVERRSLDAGRRAADVERQQLQQRLAGLAREAEESRNQLLAELQHVREELGRQHAEVQHEWEAAREGWAAERRGFENRQSALEADLEAARAAADTVKRLLDEAVAARNTREERIAELERAGEAAIAERDALRTSLDETERSAKADRREWENAWAAWDSDRRALESRIEGLDQTRHELETTVAGLTATERELNDHLGALEKTREQLELRLRETSAGFEGATEAHRQDRLAWDRDRSSLQSELESLREQYRSAGLAIESDRAAWDGVRRELEERVTALAVTTDELGDRVASMAREKERLERELRETSAHLEQSSDRHRQEQQAWEAKLAATIASHQDERRELDTAVADLATRLAGATVARDRLVGCDLFGYAVTSDNGRLVDCNPAFARIFGYADTGEALSADAGRTLPSFAEGAGTECVATRDGRQIRVVRESSLVASAEGDSPRRVQHVIVDVTGPTERDERWRQVRRRAEVGTLATLMAPDIQALVTAIREVAGTPPASTADAGLLCRRLDEANTHATAADHLVRQLVAFSRRDERRLDRCGLDDAIGRALPLLRSLVGVGVAIHVVPGTNDTVVLAQDNLDQMLTSLVIAARDLLPSGGDVALTTGRPERFDWLPAPDRFSQVQPVRLTVTAHGYEAQAPVLTPALERVVARCEGTLRVRQVDTQHVTFDVDLPTACPEQNWTPGDETRPNATACAPRSRTP